MPETEIPPAVAGGFLLRSPIAGAADFGFAEMNGRAYFEFPAPASGRAMLAPTRLGVFRRRGKLRSPASTIHKREDAILPYGSARAMRA